MRELLLEKGRKVSLINARFVKPIDEKAVDEACNTHRLIVTMEENVTTGGYGEKVLEHMSLQGYQNQFLNISIPDAYVEHGNPEILKEKIGIDAMSIVKRIEEIL